MTDAKRVILHFGLPKTGTTTIQNVLHAHRDRLLAEGVYYPALSPNLTTPLCTMFLPDPKGHITNKIAGLSAESALANAQRFQRTLEAEISRSTWSTLVLSAEGVSNMPRESLHKLKSWAEQFATEWTVLICVRDPLTYTRSVIQQLIKGGDVLHELYERLPLPNFQGKINNAIAVFGKDRLHVFSMRAAASSADGLVGHFAGIIGLSEALTRDLCAVSSRDNESMSQEAALVLDSLNRQVPMFPANGDARRRSGRELAFIERIRGSRFELPPQVRARVVAESAKDTEWLFSEFGIDLRYNGDVDPDSRRASEPSLTVETADSIAMVIADLLMATDPPQS